MESTTDAVLPVDYPADSTPSPKRDERDAPTPEPSERGPDRALDGCLVCQTTADLLRFH